MWLSGCARDGTSFLDPHGIVAAAERRWLFEITGLMMIVVLPVFILVPLFAWRYRRRNKAAAYRPEWGFSWPLEIIVWCVPIAIVGVLAYVIVADESRYDPYDALSSSQPPLKVDVVGLDWKWLFIYPDQHIATVGVLALPQDRPVSFSLTSDATMQSFFIPALGPQIYAMAGMVTRLNLMADRPGALLGENTQFNGMGFQHQSFTVSVMSPQDFATWCGGLAKNGKNLDAAAYSTLSQHGTVAKARSDFGVDQAATLAFANVPDSFFRSIVDKYQHADALAATAGQH